MYEKCLVILMTSSCYNLKNTTVICHDQFCFQVHSRISITLRTELAHVLSLSAANWMTSFKVHTQFPLLKSCRAEVVSNGEGLIGSKIHSNLLANAEEASLEVQPPTDGINFPFSAPALDSPPLL